MIESFSTGKFPNVRLRRTRQHQKLRLLVQETTLRIQDLIFPLFLHHGENIKNPIASMPGLYQLSLDQLPAEVKAITELGILGVILFGIPEEKDEQGSDSLSHQGIIQQAIRIIKEVSPELLVITDVCFCEYTDHGHCGIVNEKTGQVDVDNDETLALLANQALTHVEAGADIVAPSGSMDGVVGVIRNALDKHGYQHIPILSYTVKYASSFYGPFREAAQGAPQFGDRKSYQMDPANHHEALREAEMDIAEGADMLMVKPALPYLDIIHHIKQQYPYMPLGAYQVSGEYAMLKAAAEKGWIDERKTVMESLISIKRAGADFIISYYTKEVALWLENSK